MSRGGFNMGGGNNMQQLMMKAQKMQQDMAKLQEDLNARTFSASAGGGMVTASVYGTKMVESIKIDPTCVDPDDVEMLQDLVMSAVNAAIASATETVDREMAKVTGGMGIGF